VILTIRHYLRRSWPNEQAVTLADQRHSGRWSRVRAAGTPAEGHRPCKRGSRCSWDVGPRDVTATLSTGPGDAVGGTLYELGFWA